MSIDRLGNGSVQGLSSSAKRAQENEAAAPKQAAPAPGDSSAFAAAVAETDRSAPTQTAQAVARTQATVLTRLRIEYSEDTNRFVYQSVEPTTGTVVGQFPKEEVLRRLAFLREQDKQVDTEA